MSLKDGRSRNKLLLPTEKKLSYTKRSVTPTLTSNPRHSLTQIKPSLVSKYTPKALPSRKQLLARSYVAETSPIEKPVTKQFKTSVRRSQSAQIRKTPPPKLNSDLSTQKPSSLKQVSKSPKQIKRVRIYDTTKTMHALKEVTQIITILNELQPGAVHLENTDLLRAKFASLMEQLASGFESMLGSHE
jgi:hypothetical protein